MEQSEDLVSTGAAAVHRFEDVYTAEYVPMVRLAFLLVGGTGHAEEIVQDAFARLYERWDGLDRPGAYLRATVVNGARDVLRRRMVARRRAPGARPRTGALAAATMRSA
ncbi:MAG: sigma factor [Acidimicrobiales bacterium]